MPEEKIGAAMGAEWALNNQTYIYMNGWFHYAKLYAARIGCIGFMMIKYGWGIGKQHWFKPFPFVIVAINILIAVASDFETAIKGWNSWFLALLLHKYLEKKVNRGGMHFSPDEIIDTLKDMNFIAVSGEGYIPTYTRTDLTNNLRGSAGFRTDTQIVSKQRMKAGIENRKYCLGNTMVFINFVCYE